MIAPVLAFTVGTVAGAAAGPVWWHVALASFVGAASTWALVALCGAVWRDRG